MSHRHLTGWAGPPIGFQVSLQGPGSAENGATSQETQTAFQAAPELSSPCLGRCTAHSPSPPHPLPLHTHLTRMWRGSEEPVGARRLSELESQEGHCDSISILNSRKFLTV